jgi:two-component system, NtrC family, sensor kinase
MPPDMQIIRRNQKFEPEKEAGGRKPDREGVESGRLQSAVRFVPEEQKPVPNELEPLTVVLRENQKLIAIGRLTASIAHEINNPLESISNLLFLLGREDGLSTNAQSYLELAQQELGRVVQISKQTLNFYRETSNPIFVHVDQLLEEVLVLYRRRIEEKRLHIRREYRSQQAVRVFPGEIRQVLSNLIVNAIEASPDGGTLWLRLRSLPQGPDGGIRGLRFTIADNGNGIDPAIRRNLGMPFVTTKGHQGTGLGLWVSMSIIRRHGGKLKAHSCRRPDHHGTAFSIFLPANMRLQEVSRSSHASSETAVNQNEEPPLKAAG